MSSDDISPLLVEPITGGLYDLPDSFSLKVADRLTTAGWTVRQVDGFDERIGFYRQFAHRLGFPDYSGHNLDALWDSLRDVPAMTAVIIDWLPFAVEDRDYAARVRKVLAERTAMEPPFAVILDIGGVGEAADHGLHF
ncbi:barstar family protein [Microlunatus soli]|uniref:Barstar (Barnase inhibitor) n=1 Tax=Microlunatus soli TaxID=630515 RepID=A0A1H1PIW4_9ACTN|nr:barstar family protein [Microlunatus soli]SDS11020.1 Barstar (barnase inhibitor) [Microlunatus soli]